MRKLELSFVGLVIIWIILMISCGGTTAIPITVENTPIAPPAAPPSRTPDLANTPIAPPALTASPTINIPIAPLTVQPKPIARFEYPENSYVDENFIPMRACPEGYAMAGFHEGANAVLCRRVMAEGEENFVNSVVDAGTSRSGPSGTEMHACPPGTYMRGVHLASNNYLCSWDKRRGVGKEWVQEFEDTGSAGYGMHICPRSGDYPTYMTGLHVGQNKFLCGVHYRVDVP